MFSNVTVGLLMGIGVAAWVYGKTQRRSGGDTKTALIASSVVGVIAFIVMFTLLGMIFKNK